MKRRKKMSHPKSTIAEQLHAAELAIGNSLIDAEIRLMVSAYGYTAEKLHEGHILFEAARTAVSMQEITAGAQRATTQSLELARDQAFDAYQALSKVARAVLDSASLVALGLTGPMPRSTAAFLTVADTLFDNAAHFETLAHYGYNASRLAAERARITAYAHANQRQEAAKGAAQQATVGQEAALETLNRWTAQYLKIARVALRDRPQLLEKLGVTVRNTAQFQPAGQ
jgi:hypothetical protein